MSDEELIKRFKTVTDMRGMPTEIVDRLEALSKENASLKHELNVIRIIDMWPLWKITAVDSFRLVKGSMLDRLLKADDEIKKLTEALEQIDNWAKAYPENIFIEPTKEQWKCIANILKENGYTLDAISSSNMRHVIKGVGEIAKQALNK